MYVCHNTHILVKEKVKCCHTFFEQNYAQKIACEPDFMREFEFRARN